MRKILLFFGLFCVINLLNAQQTVTIHQNGHGAPVRGVQTISTFPASDIQFWVGTGSNSAVVIIGWDDDNPTGNFALAWGVRWNGSTTALALVDSIATYDSRLTYSFSGSMMQDILYNDGDLIGASSYGWCYTLNGSWAPNAYNNQPVADGDLMEISGSCMFSLTTATAATNPNIVLACIKAQSVSVTDLTSTTATVNITDTTNVNDYTVKLFEGDSLIDSVVIYTQTISYTSLTDNTGYRVEVYSNCTDGTQTSARSVSFRTPCIAVAHTNLPWTEDFQSGTGSSYSTAAAFFSNHVFCWDLINPYSNSDPYINSSSSVNVSGGQCLYVSSRTSSPTILVLPPFEDTPDQLRLQFDVLSSYGHGFEAGVMTDVNDESSFTSVATCLPTGSGWNHFEVTFAGNNTGRIALRSNDNGPAYLDNVTVDELPSCVKPSQVLVSNVTVSSADITITDPNATNHYMVYVAEDSVEIYSDSYTLTNLLPNTRYVVGVRTVCTDGLTNATETAFRTGCGPIAIPYHEDFSQFVDVANGYGYAVTDSTLPCWNFFKARALDRLELFTPSQSSTYGYGNDGYTLRIYGNYSNSQDILMLPELAQATNTLEISFMTRPSETGTFGGILQVGYMTDATDTASFVTVSSNPCGQFTNGYDLRTATFTNAPADARIAFRVIPTGGSAKSWYIDDLDVHDMPACARANGISVDNITTDGFTLHVDDPTSVNNYRYYITSEAGIDSLDFYDTVVTVTGLTASSDYELSVVSICDDGTLTLPHSISVSTLCGPVTELPFEEDFEGWTASQSQGMNRCWNRLYNNSSNNLVTNNYPYCASGVANALNGFKSLKMYSKGTSNDIKEFSVAYLPEFEANVTGLKVRFFYKYGGSTTNINKVRIAVGISENVTDTTTFTRLATLTPSVVGWNEFEVEFSGYTGTGNRITIMQTSTGTTAITSYIDSLVVDTISSCNRPATFEVSDITAYGATLTWTDPSNADAYIIHWSDGSSTDSVTVTGETTYELTSLTPSSNYTVDIRSICWGEPTNARTLSFATSCAPMPLPWSMDFDNISNLNQLSSCWNRYSGRYIDSTQSATLTSTTSGWARSTTALDGSSHVKLNIYGTSIKHWIVTPEINLSENAELTFDYALTKYNNANAADVSSGVDDDRFIVLATTNGGTTWVPVAQWGSDTLNRDDYYFPSISNAVNTATISLSSFTGNAVRLAFYGESTVNGNADNDLHIDNIVVAVVTDTTITPPDTTPTPVDATIAASEIDYWVGTGNTEVIFVGNWCDPEVALAWGVRFTESSTTVEAVMDTIAAYDSRFSYSGAYSIINDVYYQDDSYNLTMSQPYTGYIMYNVNGVLANFGYSDMYVQQGDLIKVGNTDCAIMTGDPYDWTSMGYAWQTTIVPVTVPATDTIIPEPTPEDASIAASDILFWVGEGTNEVVMAVNWADTALAWGYRFSTATATAQEMMDAIAAADPRFSYTGTGYITDINYIDTAAGMTTPLGITSGNWWWSLLNHVGGWGLSDVLHDGDFYKWGDLSVAVVTDSTDMGTYMDYTYVWPYTIYPVTVPDTSSSSDTTVTVVDATISQDDILFWTGNGFNKAVIAVNWADPDTCLAWGVMWNGSATVKDLMDTIMAHDSRFTYTESNGMLSDIIYTVDGLILQLTEESASPWGNYWLYNVNGSAAQDMFNAHEVHNGDFVKWGDPNSGTSIGTDEWGMDILVWTTTVTPVTVNTTGISGINMMVESIWPNPTSAIVNVSVNRNAKAALYDLSGRCLGSYTLSEGNNIIDLTNFTAGVYMLRIENSVSKIVKK